MVLSLNICATEMVLPNTNEIILIRGSQAYLGGREYD